MELQELNPKEKSRTYHYADGSSHTFKDVTHFAASTSTHRLKSEGRLIIVASGWRFIEIEAEGFTL